MHKTSAQSGIKLPESQECKHLQELLNKSKDFHDLGFFNSNSCNDLFGYLRETSSSFERTSQFGHHRKYYSGTQVNFRKLLKVFFEWFKMNAKRLLVRMLPGHRPRIDCMNIYSNLKSTMSIHFCRFMVWGDTSVLTAPICMLTFISFETNTGQIQRSVLRQELKIVRMLIVVRAFCFCWVP